ncbi:Hypp531 [Branchiostoma lanceolatum]|uniref:Hypp531 protein n=1 Tax=Branchiostoma lanceolatum TaxID=7740 RepID=A0A8J9VAK4_BRALA|nr:Hypp531 [Branchiostoma lanceolatum]
MLGKTSTLSEINALTAILMVSRHCSSPDTKCGGGSDTGVSLSGTTIRGGSTPLTQNTTVPWKCESSQQNPA